MSRLRLIIALGLLVVLAVLVGWQHHRESLMAACHARGGFWNGPRSACEPPPYGPILKRAIDRS
ncbi:MAG: hypothetical protein SFW09_05080 [Hyphomicrobiaceae bacterium]|nr:hypothetical protein [Hyphomicrobiaceae bacterium]